MSGKNFSRAVLSQSICAAVLMVFAALAAWAAKPTALLADSLGKINLEQVIPPRFGDWVTDERGSGGVVNPQQAETIQRIYSEVMSRAYINTLTGQRIMLSIAYGRDQSDDGNSLHFPEICYPAQGFQVLANVKDTVLVADGAVRVRRLQTLLGERRYEPLTYWTTVGENNVLGGTEKKIAEMRYSLKGVVPDGLIFRVSTIDRDTAQAYRVQDDFIRSLLATVAPKQRTRLAGAPVAALD